MSRDDLLKRLELMRLYGGGFVSALAEAWSLADSNNSATLERAFHHLLVEYAPERWSAKAEVKP